MNHKNSNFSEGSIEARKAQKNVFQAPKENNHQPGWADPAKLSFRKIKGYKQEKQKSN